MSTYAILGCGSVGHAVAEELEREGKDVLILDRDEDRVEALRDQDLDARTADIHEPAVAESIAERDVVLILSSDLDANEAAVKNLRDQTGERYIVVRASDPVSADELTELGADVVINPSAVISESALRALESGELEYKTRQLVDIITGTNTRMAIITHRRPNPDTIASAAALQSIAHHFDIETDVIYDGDMSHQENRAFVNLLDIDLHSRSETSLDTYDTVALINHAHAQEQAVEGVFDIYLDHDDPPFEIEASFSDIRSNVSSTSTILTKYIQTLDMTVTEDVATALLYGIRAETMDFRRGTTPADLTAAAFLYPFADHETLEQVESPSMSPETLDVLAEAIHNREVRGSHLVTNAGFVRDQDALGQAAQHLLNLEGITTSVVFAITDDSIQLAARSKDIRMNIGSVLDAAFSDIGETAGHSTDASGKIPLGIFTGVETSEENRDTLLSLVEEAVRVKLFNALGVETGDASES